MLGPRVGVLMKSVAWRLGTLYTTMRRPSSVPCYVATQDQECIASSEGSQKPHSKGIDLTAARLRTESAIITIGVSVRLVQGDLC